VAPARCVPEGIAISDQARSTGKRTPLDPRLLRDPVHLLALGFGTGLAPRAPGTAGTLVGVLFAWLSLPLPMAARIMSGVALVIAGIWLCGASARKLGVHDHSGIVWDEIAGMYLVLLFARPEFPVWTAAFLLFRLFDIWKPWPIRDMDHRLHGGTGIMLDDIAAALYAALILTLGQGIVGWIMS